MKKSRIFLLTAVILLAVVLSACHTSEPMVNPDDFVGEIVTITRYDENVVTFELGEKEMVMKSEDIRILNANLFPAGSPILFDFLSHNFGGRLKAKVLDVVHPDETDFYSISGDEVVIVIGSPE